MARRGFRSAKSPVSLVRISKSLSYMLRHGAKEHGLKMDEAGYVQVSDLQAMRQFQGVSTAQLREIVRTNDKQRFGLKEEGGILKIRANQGHTVKNVKAEALLTPITSAEGYPFVVHGTYANLLPAIKKSGLSRMQRNHIHMAKGLPGDSGVISGMRKSTNVLIYVDLAAALADGIPFFESANGVILSPGLGDSGFIPPKYFAQIVKRS